jgi:hypothetical protein
MYIDDIHHISGGQIAQPPLALTQICEYLMYTCTPVIAPRWTKPDSLSRWDNSPSLTSSCRYFRLTQPTA